MSLMLRAVTHGNKMRYLMGASVLPRANTPQLSVRRQVRYLSAAASLPSRIAKEIEMASEGPIDTAGFIDRVLAQVQYSDDHTFLSPPTPRTSLLWARCQELIKEEDEKGGLLDVDPKTPSSITAFPPGYVDRELEMIVGLQTDKPLKRAIKPNGGWRTVESALKAYGRELDPDTKTVFQKLRKTHNDGVFDIYTRDMRNARSAHLLTGLPDAYGRGRIIGDYRRVALYGTERLIEEKKQDLEQMEVTMTIPCMQKREEIAEQIKALRELTELGAMYGINLKQPAQTAKQAIQAVYMGFLAAVREQDGAAMSVGRLDTFLDAYISNDLANGTISSEAAAQELIDDLVIKLRLVRQLRTPDYNALFAGDPTWATLVIGGCSEDGRPLVTRTSYRILHTLYNLGPAPEPNLTVLWDKNLPQPFKEFCAQVSVDTSSIQYENDELMRSYFNSSDYGIACCVSAMRIGKDMQYFGARANLVKALLYGLNQGRDEVTGAQVMPAELFPRFADNAPLDYDDVLVAFKASMAWLARLYVNTMNCIHYQHDLKSYERVQMALHDSRVKRYMAFGVAGLSIVADSLSAIKFAKVTPVRDERGLITEFTTEGEFPCYGNDDDRVDALATWTIERFMKELRKTRAYRDSEHTLSVLTITSNTVYGTATGSTPDGRKKGEPFAPGANPLHGRDRHGAIASLNSVAKLPFRESVDGISNTFSIVPSTLGKSSGARASNLTALLDGYFEHKAHHLNVNVFDRAMLLDAMDHPDKYPQLTIRVSGYAVHFNKLTREQQLEVVKRTFHDTM